MSERMLNRLRVTKLQQWTADMIALRAQVAELREALTRALPYIRYADHYLSAEGLLAEATAALEMNGEMK